MCITISNVVLLSIRWESSVGVRAVVVLINLANVPFPLSNHAFFLLLCQQEENEGLIKMPDQEDVDNSNSILVSERGNFPEGVAEWVLEES